LFYLSFLFWSREKKTNNKTHPPSPFSFLLLPGFCPPSHSAPHPPAAAHTLFLVKGSRREGSVSEDGCEGDDFGVFAPSTES